MFQAKIDGQFLVVVGDYTANDGQLRDWMRLDVNTGASLDSFSVSPDLHNEVRRLHSPDGSVVHTLIADVQPIPVQGEGAKGVKNRIVHIHSIESFTTQRVKVKNGAVPA